MYTCLPSTSLTLPQSFVFSSFKVPRLTHFLVTFVVFFCPSFSYSCFSLSHSNQTMVLSFFSNPSASNTMRLVKHTSHSLNIHSLLFMSQQTCFNNSSILVFFSTPN